MKTTLPLLVMLAVASAFAAAPALAACDLEAPDAGAAGADCAQAWMDANLRLNDLQVIGTHNSYKLPAWPHLLASHRERDPQGADGIDYGHLPLREQLERGVRALELDVYYDPEGGRYRHDSLPPEQHAALRRPGFKVMHLSDIDYRSSCQPFAECLRIVRDWSRAHPRHVPLLVQINAKDGPAAPGAVQPLRFDAAAFDALDAEIRGVFPDEALIVPDEVQGDAPSLREAVLAGNWPRLGEARGRVLFALDEGEEKVALYRGKRRALEGRVLFVNAGAASPAAAWLTRNEPMEQDADIAGAVAAGFLVRTRADADTREARRNDTRRREAALAGGAQVVSTDYIEPDQRFGGYRVGLPGGVVARCNPQRAAQRCGGLPIEE
ncbi:Ca2+-dependent phosphoinositide-specific phospholipase C [Luteimonas sp. R10]|uniref:Ca2+-dependent phosphoinositide-specific phospholipase C n=1 Tax=Luteimonas sp. R10 TaxID=3108176 RepID=UPI0030878E10|nr:Ca2+-dependent phosphoinositide-specific phospholipase C [Luteimonas sp. R10]